MKEVLMIVYVIIVSIVLVLDIVWRLQRWQERRKLANMSQLKKYEYLTKKYGRHWQEVLESWGE